MRPRSPVFVVLLFTAMTLGGCLDDDPLPATADLDLSPRLVSAVATPLHDTALAWNGPRLAAPETDTTESLACEATGCAPRDCTTTDCYRVPFRIAGTDGLWKDHDGFLEVSVRWPTTYEQHLALWIEDADGDIIARGAHSGYSFSVALVAFVHQPRDGDYVAVVAATASHGTHQGSIEIESWIPDDTTRELLPDLVTLPPTDLTFDTPTWGAVGPFMLDQTGAVRPLGDASGSQGCALEEVLDSQPRRCLRFTNAVGNLGEGPLEIRLTPQDGALAPTGTGFLQRVYSSDGTHRDTPAGATEFHPYHLHFHDAAANLYTVYAYNEDTDTRQDAVATGRKTGVCFADVGLIDLGLPGTSPARYSGRSCIDPSENQDWYMGLSPNWFDGYPWLLTDQFVDIGDAPDGTYLLCSVTNQDGVLLETDTTNNEGCTRFRLNGDSIDVLDEAPYHKDEMR